MHVMIAFKCGCETKLITDNLTQGQIETIAEKCLSGDCPTCSGVFKHNKGCPYTIKEPKH